MDEPDQPNDPQEESLAAVSPTPVESENLPLAGHIGLGVITWAAAGAGALVLIAGTMTPCAGATRSTTLEWERRRLQIEQAERELHDYSGPTTLTVSQSDEPSDVQPSVGKQD